MTAPIVATEHGPVAGATAEGIDRFLGIPYAAPPVGELRFKAPQPPAAWTDPRPADRFGPTAPQEVYANAGGLPDVPEPIIEGDGFLNLNVWTPAERVEDGVGLPVLVWIHGGGFVAGCSANPWYDGSSFARKGLVVVSLNYRLGAEGFARIPGGDDNRAVLDWIAALRWVQRNIAAFGGDPGRVTVGGQSAGGIAVTTLLASPVAQGLFGRAIVASGVMRANAQSPEQADRTAERLAAALGCERSLEGFRGFTTEELVAAQLSLGLLPELESATALADAGAEPPLPWSPIVDGELVPRTFLEAAMRGELLPVPLLIGTTRHEFSWMSLWDGDRSDEAVRRGQAFTDAFFRRPLQDFLERRVAQAPAFRYEFQWESHEYEGIVRSGHSLDIPFFFDTLDAPYVEPYSGPNPPQTLADDVHGAFAAFAIDGDPGWPAWTEAAGPVRIFDVPSRLDERVEW